MTEHDLKAEIDGLLLSRDQILSADDRATQFLDVPEWGGRVKIRALSAFEQSQYEQSLVNVSVNDRGKTSTSIRMEGANVRLAAYGIVDNDNKPMFTEADLKDKASGPISRIAEAIRQLSGMDLTVEEAEGN